MYLFIYFIFYPGPPQPVQATEEAEPGQRELPGECHPQRSLHTRVSFWLHHHKLINVRLADTHKRTIRHTP